jgi:PHD/YefM family antitoxin component YafN of YafNO toxin-antitoxin module
MKNTTRRQARFRQQFCVYSKASTERPIVANRHGRAVAVLLSVEDEEELQR